MNTTDFSCYLEWNGETSKVCVEGDLDFSKAAKLASVLRECIDGGAKSLQLDFSAVTYIDSESIKVVMEAAYKAAEIGGLLLLTGYSSVVHRALSLLGLDGMLEAEETTPGRGDRRNRMEHEKR